MRLKKGMHSRILLVLLLTFGLLSISTLSAELQRSSQGLITDPDRGLTWIANGNYAIDAGLSESVVLPRAQALEALARLNAGRVENFGHSDWRLPTTREIESLLTDRKLRELTRIDARALLNLGPAAIPGHDMVVLWPVRGNVIAPGFSNVSVFATNSIELKNDAAVLSGDVVVNDASAGPTLVNGFELGLRNKAATAIGSSAVADSIQLKNKSTAGDVSFNDLDDKGTIHGTQTTPLGLPVFNLLPLFFAQAPAPGSPDVTVASGGAQSLAAGDYANITVGSGGTLALSGGVYNVSSISLGDGAQLLFDAPSEVRIEARFASGDDAVVGPSAGSGVAASDLVLYVAGLNGGDGGIRDEPFAAGTGERNLIEASFYAPNGTLGLGHDTHATGAFLARDVLIENRAEVSLESFFFNRPPVAGDDSATVDEGAAVSVLDSGETSLLANDSDPNLDSLSVSPAPVSGPSHGTVVLNADGTFSYTHDGSETSSDSFVYEVCDDGSPQECATGTVTITVLPINDPPVAVDDSATVDEGGTVSVLDSLATSVLANDSDPDSTLLSATLVGGSGPTNGTLSLNSDGTFSYTHNGTETTSDGFDYLVCDDAATPLCDTGSVAITIDPVNDPPVAVNDSATAPQGGTVSVLDSGAVSLLANDSDPDSINLTAALAVGGEPLSGTVTINPDGTFSYTHDGSEVSDDGFIYEVCDDGSPQACATAAVAVGIIADIQVTVIKFGFGGGTVTSTPGGIGCGSVCVFTFPPTGTISLTATPNATSTFAGFSGDADCVDGVLQPTGDKTCFARFDNAGPPAVVDISLAGDGSGRVLSTPAGIDCPGSCSANFTVPQRVTLDPIADEGSIFAGWTGAGDCADGVLEVAGDVSCTANFELAPSVIKVTKFGLGSGTVTSDPVGIDCGATGMATFTGIPLVELIATPDAGSVFGGFSGDPDCADGFVTPGGETSCLARFDLDTPQVVLTIAKSGAGTGTVTSSPAGIDCGATCSAAFPNPTRVNLFASPDPGSTFIGWSGPSDCSDGIVTLTSDTTCTAEFAPLPNEFTLTVIFLGGGSGMVSSNPPNLFCDDDCSALFTAGTLVQLAARPSLGSFGGWGGDCSGNGFSTSVLLDADKTCTVTFNFP